MCWSRSVERPNSPNQNAITDALDHSAHERRLHAPNTSGEGDGASVSRASLMRRRISKSPSPRTASRADAA